MDQYQRHWDNAFRRFATTIVTGGGALLFGDALTARFDGKAFVPDDPVMTVARGLYKLGRMKQDRRSKRKQAHRQ